MLVLMLNNIIIYILLVLSLVMFSVWLCSPRAQEALKTGHFVSVLQVLMQLQRVCNHPELVAPRASSSSYFCSSLQYNVPSLVLGALQDDSNKVYACALHCLNSKLCVNTHTGNNLNICTKRSN